MRSWVPLRHFRIGIVDGVDAGLPVSDLNTNKQETSRCTRPFVSCAPPVWRPLLRL